MVITCCVRGCKNENYPGSGVSFHAFPHNIDIRNLWMKAVQRDNWNPTQHSRICSKHFPQEYFINGRKKNMLLKDAIPTENTATDNETPSDRSDLNDQDHITTMIERKRSTIKKSKWSKSPVFILKSPTRVTTFHGRLARVFLKERERYTKLLQRLRLRQRICKTLKDKVTLLEDELRKLKTKPVYKGAPLVLTLSNDMYEKETLTIRVGPSE